MKTLDEVKTILKTLGYTPSNGSWEDQDRIYVFSQEHCGPATYGHSQCALDYKKATNKLYRNNQEIA